jgi:hypothetical protein
MAESRFWHLAGPSSTKRYAEWIHGEMKSEQVICPINAGDRRGGKRLTDLSIALRGGAVQDFVCTWYSEFLVQDHGLQLFKASGLSGYQVKPVRAKFKRQSKQQPPILWEVIVTGWAGMAPAESGIKLVEQCPGCGYLRYSECTDIEKLIDESQWDGSDFFIVWPLPKFIFVTGRVAQVIRDNRLSGAILLPPNELDLTGGFSPGRLSYWMPPERARQLGAGLGIE